MNCDHVQGLLNAYVDAEIDLVTALEIEQHLSTCQDCSQQYAGLLALRSAIASERPHLYQAAPEKFTRRVRSSLRASVQGARSPAPFAWRLAAAVFGVLLLVLAAGFTGSRLGQAGSRPLAEAVLSAHVRSLLADHLTDVASTDQHTVKPWFDGRLDFSPPVADFSVQGYPLIGGRLDYIDGHPAAAIVYMRSKHIINLFVWLSTSSSPTVRISHDNGYNIIQWSHSGMEFWAVSDLNTSELQAFVELVQKE